MHYIWYQLNLEELWAVWQLKKYMLRCSWTHCLGFDFFQHKHLCKSDGMEPNPVRPIRALLGWEDQGGPLQGKRAPFHGRQAPMQGWVHATRHLDHRVLKAHVVRVVRRDLANLMSQSVDHVSQYNTRNHKDVQAVFGCIWYCFIFHRERLGWFPVFYFDGMAICGLLRLPHFEKQGEVGTWAPVGWDLAQTEYLQARTSHLQSTILLDGSGSPSFTVAEGCLKFKGPLPGFLGIVGKWPLQWRKK